MLIFHQKLLLSGLNEGGKTRNIAVQVARFTEA